MTGAAIFDAFLAEGYERLVAKLSYARQDGIEPRDVVHDALLVAYRKMELDPGCFASVKGLFAYLYVVTTREIVLLKQAAALHVTLADEDHDDTAPATRLDPERLVLGRDALRRVLGSLSPLHLRALSMVVEGLGPAQIADALGLPSAHAAHSLVYRARQAAHREFGRAVVVPLTPGLLRLRQLAADIAPVSGQAGALASAVVLSLLAVIASPPASSAGRTDDPSRPRGERLGPLPAGSALAAGTGRPGQAPFGSDGAAGTAASVVAVAPDAQPSRPARGPLALDAPRPPCVRVCLTTEDGPRPRGEVVRLKPTGSGGPGVSQDVTPLCDRMPDNPAVACERGQEPEQWTVKDLPPVPEPGGTPA